MPSYHVDQYSIDERFETDITILFGEIHLTTGTEALDPSESIEKIISPFLEESRNARNLTTSTKYDSAVDTNPLCVVSSTVRIHLASGDDCLSISFVESLSPQATSPQTVNVANSNGIKGPGTLCFLGFPTTCHFANATGIYGLAGLTVSVCVAGCRTRSIISTGTAPNNGSSPNTNTERSQKRSAK